MIVHLSYVKNAKAYPDEEVLDFVKGILDSKKELETVEFSQELVLLCFQMLLAESYREGVTIRVFNISKYDIPGVKLNQYGCFPMNVNRDDYIPDLFNGYSERLLRASYFKKKKEEECG